MENIEFDTLNWFQYGFIVTLRSIIELQLYMKEKFSLPYLLTAHVDQDYHEGFNGQMRGSDGRGGVRNPTHLQLHTLPYPKMGDCKDFGTSNFLLL